MIFGWKSERVYGMKCLKIATYQPVSWINELVVL